MALKGPRGVARAEGGIHFHTGVPCARGHTSARYVSSGGCVECTNIDKDARRQAAQEAKAGSARPSTCQVCDTQAQTCFDHCHTHGHFRGWLCHRCNKVLGHVKDSPALLYKLAQYLTQDQERQNGCQSALPS